MHGPSEATQTLAPSMVERHTHPLPPGQATRFSHVLGVVQRFPVPPPGRTVVVRGAGVLVFVGVTVTVGVMVLRTVTTRVGVTCTVTTACGVGARTVRVVTPQQEQALL